MDELDPKDDELKEVELPESDDDGLTDEDDDLLSGPVLKKGIIDDDADESLDAMADEELAAEDEDSYDDVDKW